MLVKKICIHCKKRNARGNDECGPCRGRKAKAAQVKSPWASKAIAMAIVGEK